MSEILSLDIRRCPFCWSRPTHDDVLFDEEGRYFVYCKICSAQGPNVKRQEAAIGLWNCAMIMREKGEAD